MPEDSQEACVVPICKGEGERSLVKNYRGIRMISIPWKVFGRVVMERIEEATE